MALVSMRQLLDHAGDHSYGIPAFNINNLEQVRAIMDAADNVNAPVILQASHSAYKYAGPNFLHHLIRSAAESYPHIPIAMHQDHGRTLSMCVEAIKNGCTSVMIDGSLESDGKTISSYEYNVDISRKTVELAHSIGVSVETELGVLGSIETMTSEKEDGHGPEGKIVPDKLLTDSTQAVDFIQKTDCDALAIAIGTSHGAFKFTKNPTEDILTIERVKEIHKRIPNTHLVMHGASSIPQSTLNEIRKFGGCIKETYGVPVKTIIEMIKYGVRKINIDTDLRLTITAAIRRYFFEYPSEFDPRVYLKDAHDAARKMCEARYIDFGCAGKADKIKPISLERMVKRYEKARFSRF